MASGFDDSSDTTEPINETRRQAGVKVMYNNVVCETIDITAVVTIY